jgi:hypothetical protein
LSGRWLSRRCRWIQKSWRCCPIEGIGGCGPLTRMAGPRGIERPWDWRRGTRRWPGCHPLCGAIGPCSRLQRPEAHLSADQEFYPRPGAAETGAQLPRQRRRWGGLRIAAVSLSDWGNVRGLCR